MISVTTGQEVDCSGYNACVEAYPKHCTEMVPDKRGFSYPKVDVVTRINCGACEKVCPFQNGNVKLDTPLIVYAVWNKDGERYLASPSGGAAYVFSSHIIK